MSVEITQQLADIAAMEDAFVQPSCIPYQPMVKYPETGTPPTLDFSIPQSTKFMTYGKLIKFIDALWFKQFTRNVPTYNFFNYVKTLTPQAVTQLFHPNVMAPAPVLGTFVPLAGGPVTGGVMPSGPSTGGVMPHGPAGPSGPTGPATPAAHSPLGASGGLSAHQILMASGPLSASSAHAAGPPQLVSVGGAAPSSAISNFAQQGIRGLYTHRIMTGGATVKYVAQPPVPVPRIMVIEEYTTASYLGNYGAGRVIKTFTLLPGERTTISIRTYKDSVTTASQSQNVLDSFSDTSATELDNLMQKEQGSSDSSSGTSGGNDASYNTYSDSHNSQSAWNISAKFGLGDMLSIGGGYGRSTSDTSTSGGGFADSHNYSNTSARASNINSLTSALEKHVQQSNAYRQVNVNNTSATSVSAGEEDLTIREIQNVNLKHVLNFTFRQLLQEYTTLTWLSGLKFAYTNGYPESYKVVDLANLPSMLADIILPGSPAPGAATYVDQVMCLLLKPYCSVLDYQDNPNVFVEAIQNTFGGCLSQWLPDCEPESELIWRKAASAKQRYSEHGLDVIVDGIILAVQKQTLLTSSIIGDALLGAGNALDCYNEKVQNATTMAGYINNLRAMQQLESDIQAQTNDQAAFAQNLANDQDIADQKLATINAILTTPDAVTAATHYKKVYGDCCDVPQNTDCGGCGCDGRHPS